MKNMAIVVSGVLGDGVTAKDLALHIIAEIGTAGGTGHVMEFRGPAIEALSMEGRMTLCNLSIEGGARAGLIAPDETTYEYMKGRPATPKAGAWEVALKYWETLKTDDGAVWDEIVRIDGANVLPTVTWGTSPEQAIPVAEMTGTPVQRVFIGSCTNSRIEDLRAAAAIAEGAHVAQGVRAMVVPGSGLVRAAAEAEGLDEIFIAAGFEWREPGCSMCLGMNPDILAPGERCASTSNRNFEGRQGRGGRTHLMSPTLAAKAAVTGVIG
ncbi:UNVERIFIED_CONTAM: hypothetical protein GTU68_000644 [Idotea baltica]|nr:hypothetical protein [Idotea baltica]